MAKYDHKKIESKWQKKWEEKKVFVAKDKSSNEKYYCLVEFPYPSGEGLHVGHPRPFTALDILSRKRRMQGYNVLYPMGFDAFGLPTENYAIKTGIHPAKVTKDNIATFTKQLKLLGFSFDWDRQVNTTDPKYYKWTQWIFLQMYKQGLAYKDKMIINWCPSCKIGLANEEVVNGNCERCGHEVEKREKEQWMLRITEYADRLIEDLDQVDYIDQVKTQQINWIGRSDGAAINFKIDGHKNSLEVYTTRPDTLFGATFMVLAPEHELVEKIITDDQKKVVTAYINAAKKKTDIQRTEIKKEKTGVFTGAYAVNPATNKKIPIWVADYVLLGYGTGAIMAVPAHDQRDYDFAKKYDLKIVEVVAGGDIEKEAFTDNQEGQLINSAQFDDLPVNQAKARIVGWLEDKGVGEAAVNYKIRDWVFSRQRYWGEPIPMIHCHNCVETGASSDGWIPVPEKDLPVELPDIKKYEPTDSGESPLASITDWVNVKCPKCGQDAKRETDTMPTWAGSNWYFLRYLDPDNSKHLADKKKLEYWMPVDWYNGGMEHTTLHLLYSRFIYKFLYDIGAVPEKHGPEPYKKRTSHGLVLGEGGEKMSKSRGNVVNPNEVVDNVGADTLRLYEMFMGPFEQAIPWDAKGVIGVRRFLERVWGIYNLEIVKEENEELISLLHRTIKKVSSDIETQDYNTAVSQMMILTNKIIELGGMDKFTAETFLKILSPFAPHIAEELWEKFGNKGFVCQQEWPEFDSALAKEKEIELIVQVNGKVRDKLKVEAGITEQMVEKKARASKKVAKYLENKAVKNVVFVPDRLINFVV